MDKIKQHRFAISIANDELDDLKDRLTRVRWPNTAAGPAWAYGTSLAYMKNIVTYWKDSFNWREIEARMNQFSHYRLPIEDRKIHLLIETGSGINPTPLLLCNGWPSSFIEYLPVIEKLAHPERFGGSADDGFTVIIPSMPGYGFSDPPSEPIAPREVARLYHQLLTETLNISRIVAHGTDWGVLVVSWLAFDFPKTVAAIQISTPALLPSDSREIRPFDDEEKAYFKEAAARRRDEFGYQVIHGTKPQTLSYGLTDSPVGLAAWILEKYHDWCVVRHTDAPPPMDRDLLLATVMLYWLRGANATTWIYRSLILDTMSVMPAGSFIGVPTGLIQFPDDNHRLMPKQYVSRSYNEVERVVAPYGGHFPALENPDFLVENLQRFFATYRH